MIYHHFCTSLVASSLRTLMNESLDFPMQGFPFPIPVTSTGASTCSASESNIHDPMQEYEYNFSRPSL